MCTHTINSLKGLFLVFILPLALLTLPNPAWAHHEQVAQATGSPEMGVAPKAEGSKSKEYSQGSPRGMMGGPHGKSEGSGSKRGYGKGYGHKEGSYGKHGYSRHGYGKHGYRSYGHGGHGRDPFRHILHFAHELGLSFDQVQQIRDKQFNFKKLRIELKAQHKIAHLDLDQQVHSGKLDEGALRAVGDRLKQIKSKKIDGMIEAKIALLKILTDEQRKKIAPLHARGAGKGHGYKGHPR